MKMYRRQCLRALRDAALVGGAAGLPTVWAWAQERPGVRLDPTRPFEPSPILRLEHIPTPQERDAMAAIAQKFMADYSVPGFSVAIARHGEIVYSAGFGVANRATGETVTTRSRFRIASVTKPITSVALFTLIEEGGLSLDTKPFERPDLLALLAPSPAERLLDGVRYEKLNRVTIRHLMTHTCGGWQNDNTDPMFHNTEMGHAELIKWTVRNQPLGYTPGTHYAYSNFGYCILGRVIEKLTGESYESYVKRAVLSRCGITDMEIAGNVAPKANEVAYYDTDPKAPYGMNVARMDSHGGWIATPTDLVRFATRVDGLSATRDILRPETFKTMTNPTTANPTYACGWNVNAAPNWWHNGNLPGTSSIMVRTASGLCWAGVTNWHGTPGIDLALDQMLWKMAKAVPAWQA